MTHLGRPWTSRFARVFVTRAMAIVLLGVGAWALAPGSQPFDHSTTKFPLVGPHANVACESCHPPAGTSRKWAGVPKDCHGCHGDRTNHRGALGAACEKCHSVTTWTALRHDAAAHHFPLTGAHDRPCAACHAGGTHFAASVTCNECHKKQHGGTDAVCSTCHRTDTWHATTYKHKFPPERLPGPHLTAPCLGCHAGFRFANTSFSCASCHRKDLKHDDLGECSKCHDAFSWGKKSGRFDHEAAWVGFPLTDKHVDVACEKCHTEPRVFANAPLACEGCHQTTPHADLGPCARCHTTATFAKPGFSHDTTRFALDERHRQVACPDCHARVPPGTFTPGPSACEICHKDPHGGQFAGAVRAASGPPRSRPCSECHVTRAFVPSTIDVAQHAAFRYPLLGAHQRVPCAGCHGPGARARAGERVFVGTKNQCIDCHADHHEGLLGTACAACHDETTWRSHAPFDHQARTRFALEGTHATVACEKCHVHGDKLTRAGGEPPTCATCHTSEHGDAFGKQCTRCHTVTRFSDARRFDHATTSFPLERRHRSVPCASCHKPKVARLPDMNCSSCHGDPHAGRTFLDCGNCHRPDNWLLVRYDHDKAEFPLKGKHFFTPCKDCHTNDVWTGLRRECVSCHRGDRQKADVKFPAHAPLSWDCIECHRPWSWDARP